MAVGRLRRRAARNTGPKGGVKVTVTKDKVGSGGGVYRTTQVRDGKGKSRGRKKEYLGAR